MRELFFNFFFILLIVCLILILQTNDNYNLLQLSKAYAYEVYWGSDIQITCPDGSNLPPASKDSEPECIIVPPPTPTAA